MKMVVYRYVYLPIINTISDALVLWDMFLIKIGKYKK